MRNKKGISPLIATVLLIGFTVALAAVIMTWGLDYIKGTTKKVDETTEAKFKCVNDLSFDVRFLCDENKIEIDALKSSVDIASVLIRVKDSTGTKTSMTINETIPVTGARTIDVDLTDVVSVDVLASIRLESGKILMCSEAVKEDLQNPC
ncbi:MAG: archaellin/type IV pilin N-terminal domain-containing protein [Nanoarchaeota archaeon]